MLISQFVFTHLVTILGERPTPDGVVARPHPPVLLFRWISILLGTWKEKFADRRGCNARRETVVQQKAGCFSHVDPNYPRTCWDARGERSAGFTWQIVSAQLGLTTTGPRFGHWPFRAPQATAVRRTVFTDHVAVLSRFRKPANPGDAWSISAELKLANTMREEIGAQTKQLR